MPDLITREASRLRIVALVHLPLAAACDLDCDTAARFEDGERRALRAAALVIVTGSATLPLIARHELARDRVVVVELGTDRAPLARGSGGHPLELLGGDSQSGKGHEGLLVALSAVPHREWHPDLRRQSHAAPGDSGAGAHDNREARAGGSRLARRRSRGDRTGGVLLTSADVFVLATRQETYGMAVAEALAHGLPIVATMTGAIPELVGVTRACWCQWEIRRRSSRLSHGCSVTPASARALPRARDVRETNCQPGRKRPAALRPRSTRSPDG